MQPDVRTAIYVRQIVINSFLTNQFHEGSNSVRSKLPLPTPTPPPSLPSPPIPPPPPDGDKCQAEGKQTHFQFITIAVNL